MAKTGRTQRGAATRRRIVDAATRLFVEDGYLDTTMAGIAAEAEVAVQTLYLSFGSKVAILAACHDVAVVGDDEPVPVLDRPWVTDAIQDTDGRRALSTMIEHTLAIIERVAPIQSVIRAASADPEVAHLQESNKANRYLTLRTLVEQLTSKRGFATSVDRAADLYYTYNSEELLQLLVIERSWPVDEWKEWVRTTLTTAMFPSPARGRIQR